VIKKPYNIGNPSSSVAFASPSGVITVPVPQASSVAPGGAAPTKPVASVSSTLHYGGSLKASSPTGMSVQPQAGDTFKKQKRLEMIVRMEAAGIPERALAAMLTITVPRLRYIKKGPDYLSVRMRLVHGIVLDTDKQLSVIREQRKEMLSQLLPPALQVIANTIMKQPTSIAEQKLQIATAQDLLDREGTFAKVSRTEVKPVSFFDFETSDREATSVLDAIMVAAKAPRELAAGAVGAAASEAAPSLSQRLVETNDIFANSDTISQIDQETALADLEASERTLSETEKAFADELLLSEKPATDKLQ